jgi:hypothetical protein
MRQIVMEATDGKRDFFDSDPNLPLYSAFAFEFPMYRNTGKRGIFNFISKELSF